MFPQLQPTFPQLARSTTRINELVAIMSKGKMLSIRERQEATVIGKVLVEWFKTPPETNSSARALIFNLLGRITNHPKLCSTVRGVDIAWILALLDHSEDMDQNAMLVDALRGLARSTHRASLDIEHILHSLERFSTVFSDTLALAICFLMVEISKIAPAMLLANRVVYSSLEFYLFCKDDSLTVAACNVIERCHRHDRESFGRVAAKEIYCGLVGELRRCIKLGPVSHAICATLERYNLVWERRLSEEHDMIVGTIRTVLAMGCVMDENSTHTSALGCLTKLALDLHDSTYLIDSFRVVEFALYSPSSKAQHDALFVLGFLLAESLPNLDLLDMTPQFVEMFSNTSDLSILDGIGFVLLNLLTALPDKASRGGNRTKLLLSTRLLRLQSHPHFRIVYEKYFGPFMALFE